MDLSINPFDADPGEIELINARVAQHEKEIKELREEINILRQERNQVRQC